MKVYQDPVYRFNFDKMTRRDMWAFLLMLVTAPSLAVQAWKAYKAPKAVADTLMVGYKGVTVYDAGFFYAPYIPLQTVSCVTAMKPPVAFKTRYGDIKPNSDYYRNVRI